MRVLLAPDKYRGSLTASQAAAAMAAGARLAGHETRELPMADGGEGFAGVIVSHGGGMWLKATVEDALGRSIEASYGLLPDSTAVIETSAVIGLAQVAGRVDAVRASSRGAGQLIAAAIEGGARRVLVGVGGSAMTDGGSGALDALGWSLHGIEVVVACDVTTLFLDAAQVFGPQKGASPDDVVTLTGRLHDFADILAQRTGRDVRRLPGSGAAGGLGGGLASLGATMMPGIDLVATAVGLDDALRWAEVVVTGEGSLDATSLEGKVVGEVLRRAAASRTQDRVTPAGSCDRVVIAGRVVRDEVRSLRQDCVRLMSLVEQAGPEDNTFTDAVRLLTDATRDALSGNAF